MLNLYHIIEDAIGFGEIGKIEQPKIVRNRIKKLIYKAAKNVIPAVNNKKNIQVFVYQYPSKMPMYGFYQNCLNAIVGKRLVYAGVHHHTFTQGRIIIVLITE